MYISNKSKIEIESFIFRFMKKKNPIDCQRTEKKFPSNIHKNSFFLNNG